MNTIDFRRHLHRNPEPALAEQATMAFISEQLDALSIEHCPIARTGILARIEGRRGNAKRCVVLRATIGADSVSELTGAEWASQQQGVMHNYGGDCNAAVVFGVLKRLQANRDFEGTLLALFQPGGGDCVEGAKAVLAENPFADYDVAAVVAQCLDSDLEVGRLGFFPGKFIPSLDRMRFEVKGENSVVAAADLILRLDALRSDVSAVATCSVRTCGDEDCSPERTIVDGTMRVLNEGLRSRLKEMIAHAAEEIDYKYDVEIDTEIEDCVPCVDNNTHLSYEAMLLADSLGFEVEDLEERKAIDDFGCYAQRYHSLLYSVGVGRESGVVGSALFLPDERALEVGEEFMTELALSILNK